MKRREQVSFITFTGVFLALSVILNIIESIISPLVGLPPGVKLGLSNIIIMFCLLSVNYRTAFMLSILKSIYIITTRGITAGVLSVSGGLCSIVIMILVLIVSKNKASYFLLSTLGGMSHNIAQILIASIIVKTHMITYYLPILIISGILAGTLTAIILKVVTPELNKIYKKFK